MAENQFPVLRLSDLLMEFKRLYPLDLLSRFSGVEPEDVRSLAEAGSCQDDVAEARIRWVLELCLDKDRVSRVQVLRNYMAEWQRNAVLVSDQEEGTLDAADIEQLEMIHTAIDREVEEWLGLFAEYRG